MERETERERESGMIEREEWEGDVETCVMCDVVLHHKVTCGDMDVNTLAVGDCEIETKLYKTRKMQQMLND